MVVMLAAISLECMIMKPMSARLQGHGRRAGRREWLVLMVLLPQFELVAV